MRLSQMSLILWLGFFAAPAAALPESTYNIRVHAGVTGARTLLSVNQSGASADLWREDDASGRQRWVLQKSADGESYNILVQGGVSGNRRFLSTNGDGTKVDLYHRDDGSGRQRWLLEPVGDQGAHRVRIAGGVKGGRVWLSTTADGSRVDLWRADDNSGRQRWMFSDLTPAEPLPEAFEGARTLDCGPTFMTPQPPPEPGMSDVSYIVAVASELWPNGSTLVVCYLKTLDLQPESSGNIFTNIDRAFSEVLDDPNKQQDFDFIKKHASVWTQYANIKFDFIGPCVDSRPAHIRIGTEVRGTNWWSPALGGPRTLPCAGQSCPASMSLDVRSKRVVLHEFGHALGLAHEQKNPKVSWNWDKDALERDGVKWSQYETPAATTVYSTQLDVYSIMMYSIPYRYIQGGKQAWLAAYPGFPLGRDYEELSPVDREYIARLYPKSGARDVGFDKDPRRSVLFYPDTRFRGTAREFVMDMANLRDIGFNDRISSVRVLGETKVAALYQHRDYRGNCLTVQGDLERMPDGFNDQVTSIRFGIACPELKATLYQDTQHRGKFVQLFGDAPNLRDIGLHDAVSSIKLGTADRIAVYTDINFAGVCAEVTGDVARTAELRVGNDRISSVKIGGQCPAVALILFQDTNYGGKQLAITADVANLKNAGFNDSASSIRVVKGVSAVYQDTNYRGRCMTVTRDLHRLSETPIGNDRISSIRVGRGCP